MAVHTLILAGGSGTRLWPLSRAGIPKHLLPLAGGGKTLLRATVQRVAPVSQQLHIVTAGEQESSCRAAVDGFDVGIIAEPMARGTGPALALAVATIAATDPDAIMASVHADSHVHDAHAYQVALVAALGWVEAEHSLVCVGLQPMVPATGLGYVEIGAPLALGKWRAPHGIDSQSDVALGAAALSAFNAPGFTEKPDLETAKSYLRAGSHLWNIGIFAWRASDFLRQLAHLEPEVMTSINAIVASSDKAQRAELYGAIKTQAIESMLFERAEKLSAVRASFGWSDLGSWPDLHDAETDAGHGDDAGNLIVGDGIALNSTGCTVESRGKRFVAVVGATDMVVVDTDDAVLVVPRSEAQRVKDVVEWLRANGRQALL